MPSPETADLRALSDADLRTQLEESHRALFNLRFQAQTRQLADVAQVRAARRRIARLKTLMREREIVAAYEAAGVEVPAAIAVAEPPADEEQPAEEAPADDDDAADDDDDVMDAEVADDEAMDDGETSDAEEQE